MPRTISPASQIGLPSLHRVFALQDPLPPTQPGPSYWSVSGQYVLDQKLRTLYGLTNASQQEETALQVLHQRLRRYYDGRLDISGLNRAQEGTYFHQEDIQHLARPLRSYFSASRQRLSLAELEMIQGVFAELKKLRDQFDLTHPMQSLDDIWLCPQSQSTWWQGLLPASPPSVLFINFLAPPATQTQAMEERLHRLLADFLGQAYQREFSAQTTQS
ncbi:MAG: hypothetical protein AAGM67_02280 [Bacteroidota bacterium]